MTKYVLLLLCLIFFVQPSMSEEILVYEPPLYDKTVLGGNWIINGNYYANRFIKTDVHYKLSSRLVESIGIFDKRYYKLKKDDAIIKDDVDFYSSFNIPTVALASKTWQTLKIAYDVLSKKDGSIQFRSQMLLYPNTDIKVVPHRPGYFVYIFNDLKKIVVWNEKTKKNEFFSNYHIYTRFVKPLVDALYIGNDIVLHLVSEDGYEETLFIEGQGFANTMIRFSKM